MDDPLYRLYRKRVLVSGIAPTCNMEIGLAQTSVQNRLDDAGHIKQMGGKDLFR